jgi:DNA-binding transcriptional MerR regulator
MAGNKKPYLTIGELVKKFKKYYPDLTSSKLRFLESKGLIVPKRADNRYRVYFKNDVKRINLILSMQQEYFLPLEVIKEKIDTIDFNKIDEQKGALKELQTKLDEGDKNLKIRKLNSDNIREKYKLTQDYIDELIEQNLIKWHAEDGKNFVDGYDLEILRIASELSKFGIYAKHLKVFENSASRQSAFLQQIIYPLIMASGKESHKRATKMLYRLEALFNELHEILFKKENKQFLDSHK